MTSHIYDLIIIGSGPAGLAAAVYAQRACLDTLIIERSTVSGGQILNTYEVDNYPGYPGISGYELGMKLREHADKLGAHFKEDTVLKIEDKGPKEVKRVIGMNATYEARALILATGASHKKLGIPGETELAGAGVSYCATCDGAFFKDKTAVVVGGGNMAVEDAIFLSRICKKVYLLHRRDELRADEILQESLSACENVEMIWNSVAVEIQGTECVTRLKIRNVLDDTESVIDTDGVFIAVGILPNTEKFKGLVKLDEAGYIIAGEEGITETPGVFAAGDIRTKMLRQVVTAVADGANAVISAHNYLIRH